MFFRLKNSRRRLHLAGIALLLLIGEVGCGNKQDSSHEGTPVETTTETTSDTDTGKSGDTEKPADDNATVTVQGMDGSTMTQNGADGQSAPDPTAPTEPNGVSPDSKATETGGDNRNGDGQTDSPKHQENLPVVDVRTAAQPLPKNDPSKEAGMIDLRGDVAPALPTPDAPEGGKR